MSEALSGAEFKKQLRAGTPKIGLFLNSHSPTVAEQLAHSGYDWLLVDTQHGPMATNVSPPCLRVSAAAAPRAWFASGVTAIDPAFSRLSTWVPTAFSFRTSIPPKKP